MKDEFEITFDDQNATEERAISKYGLKTVESAKLRDDDTPNTYLSRLKILFPKSEQVLHLESMFLVTGSCIWPRCYV